MLLHHGLLVHGSAPNPTDETIVTYTIQYAAADAFAYTAPVIDSAERNRMVRGEATRFARLEEGSVELPPDFSAGYTSLFANQDKAQGVEPALALQHRHFDRAPKRERRNLGETSTTSIGFLHFATLRSE